MAKDNDNIQEAASGEKKSFFNDSKKVRILSIIVGVVVVAGLGYLAYYQFMWKPKNEESKTVYWKAAANLEKDSLNLAINGDGTYPGFATIAKNYSGTIGGEVSEYALGIAYLNQGEFQNALTFLAKVELEDEIVSTMAIGCMGDAYWELGQTGEALQKYEEAIAHNPNQFTTPYFLMKAGMLLQAEGRPGDALEKFEAIKNDWPESNQARGIEKYIAVVGG